MKFARVDNVLMVAWLVFRWFGWNPGVVVVVSESMVPYAHVGDAFFVLNTTVNKNDVVVFRHRGNQIIHRVVWVDANRFLTKGDANFVDDRALYKTYLKRNQIEAKVIRKLPIPKEIGRGVHKFFRSNWIYVYVACYLVDLFKFVAQFKCRSSSTRARSGTTRAMC